MVLVDDWTMTTRGSTRVSVNGLGDKRDTFFSNKCPFLNWVYTSTVDFVLPKKDTNKKYQIDASRTNYTNERRPFIGVGRLVSIHSVYELRKAKSSTMV